MFDFSWDELTRLYLEWCTVVVRVPTLCLPSRHRSACSPHMQVTDIVKQVIQWLDGVVMLGIADRHICACKQMKLINMNIKHNNECSVWGKCSRSLGQRLSLLLLYYFKAKSCNYSD